MALRHSPEAEQTLQGPQNESRPTLRPRLPVPVYFKWLSLYLLERMELMSLPAIAYIDRSCLFDRRERSELAGVRRHVGRPISRVRGAWPRQPAHKIRREVGWCP
jgi:hypothetical protein